MIAEPAVIAPEKVFEDAIVSLIHDILRAAGRSYSIVPKFGLDIGMFISDDNGSYARFIEAKSYAAGRAGGVGFGNGRGEGAQVTMLLCPESELEVIDKTVRWVLADATRESGQARYAFFDCRTAKAAAMAGVARGKQNNLKVSHLSKNYMTWPKLVNALQAFVLRGGPSNPRLQDDAPRAARA